MRVEVGGLLVSCAANLLLGLIVGSRNWRGRENLSFAWLTASIAAWNIGIAVFTAEITKAGGPLFFINAYYFAALSIACALSLFAVAWSGSRYFWHVARACGIVLAAWAATLAVQPHAIVNSVRTVGGLRRVDFSMFGQTVYSLFFLLIFGSATAYVLWYSRRVGGKRGRSTVTMVKGIVVAGVVGVVCNLILPWFGDYSLVWVGPQASVVFVWLIAYLIIRRRLFSIRLTIARSLAYFMALTAAVAAYIAIVALVAHYLDFSETLSGDNLLLYVGLAVLTSITFHPIKRFFDHTTNRWFYKDTYDSQALLDRLNDILVSSTDLDELLGRTSGLVNATLKVPFTHFVFDASFSEAVLAKYAPSKADMELEQALSKSSAAVIVTDEQIWSERAQKLAELLDSRQVGLVARMQTSRQHVGYILVGNKNTGEGYLPGDEQVLKLISDELAIAIQSVLRFQEIQHFNETLQGRINRATSELRGSNRRLKELDSTKDDFISMASHQLRTPLTSVKGYLSMVLDGDAGELNGQQRKLLQQSYNSSQQMVYLISDLLNLSRLKTGKFVIEPSPVNLADVVQDQYDRLQELARAKSIAFTFERPEHFPHLMLDETKMQQVVMNLADNALHYTPQGGKVVLSLRETTTAVEYTVQDNGIGVPKGEQHKLFSKMFRASNAQKTRPDGTGLGLFMAKKVVVAQGGSILFESREGKGSMFGFRLPKAHLQVTGESTPLPGATARV